MKIMHKETGLFIDTDEIGDKVIIHKEKHGLCFNQSGESLLKEIWEYNGNELKSLVRLQEFWDVRPDAVDLTTDELEIILSSEYFHYDELVNNMKNKIYSLIRERALRRR